MGVVLLSELGKGIDGAFGHLGWTACSPPGCWMADAMGGWRRRGVSHCGDRGGFALRLVDIGLLFTFGLGDGGLPLAGGNIDLLLAAAFGRGDQRASRSAVIWACMDRRISAGGVRSLIS